MGLANLSTLDEISYLESCILKWEEIKTTLDTKNKFIKQINIKLQKHKDRIKYIRKNEPEQFI